MGGRRGRLSWLAAGILLAVLDVLVFNSHVTDRPIGASTTYPYVGAKLFGATATEYFAKVQKPGSWELIFLFGAFLGGLVGALVFGDFRLTALHKRWIAKKGTSSGKRLVWAFVGGFLLIWGARMAGGCTSGHILSGGMQTAVSSLVFGLFVVTGLLVVGRLFYGGERG